MVDAVLVDMEGVVRDSRNAFHHAYEEALRSQNLKLISYPEETWRLRGYSEFNSRKNFLKAIYAISKSGDDLTKVFWKKHPIEYMNTLIKKHAPARDSMEKMEDAYSRYLASPRVLRRVPPVRAGKIGVRLLREDNVPVGIVTNSHKDYNQKWMEHKKLHGKFDAIVTADETGVPKPAPDMLLKCCEKLGVKPKKTVYVGDTEVDILAAKSAGCIPIGVVSGGTERHVLRDMGAAYVFRNLTDFALWMRRGGKL